MRPAYDPNKEELFSVSGDMESGVSTTADMTSGAIKIPLRYSGKHGEFVCVVDVYQAGDGSEISIVMYCPKCRHSMKIPSNRKKIEFDPDKGLFVEPSECPWESGERGDERIEFGLNLCRFRFVIEGTRIRDA